MKRTASSVAVFIALLLCTPRLSSAQEAPAPKAPRLAVSLHGNTGTPPMLGVSYRLGDRAALRTSAGFLPESGRYDFATSTSGSGRVTYETNWYGGALAGLYYLPNLWIVQPYTGLKAQYVYASSTNSEGHARAADRTDVGGLAGAELHFLSWLGLFGEVGIGYRSGLERNSGMVGESLFIGMEDGSEFGLIHAGLGLQIRFN